MNVIKLLENCTEEIGEGNKPASWVLISLQSTQCSVGVVTSFPPPVASSSFQGGLHLANKAQDCESGALSCQCHTAKAQHKPSPPNPENGMLEPICQTVMKCKGKLGTVLKQLSMNLRQKQY